MSHLRGAGGHSFDLKKSGGFNLIIVVIKNRELQMTRIATSVLKDRILRGDVSDINDTMAELAHRGWVMTETSPGFIRANRGAGSTLGTQPAPVPV